jgi:hypothetical protein
MERWEDEMEGVEWNRSYRLFYLIYTENHG